MNQIAVLRKIAKLIRYYILISSSAAGSGHPTSSLSATELMTGLLFGGSFRFDADHPHHPNNDRLIFSKGHASPLFYSLWATAGKVSEEELKSFRKFGSPLEGHPTISFKYAEAATGSLGQGLSIGLGMALNAKYLDKLPYRTYVLLGDSEMAEGSQWEAMEIAANYRLGNLIGIIDVNRLGQRGGTMYGHDLAAYERRISSFGWRTMCIDGHNLDEIRSAYQKASETKDQPVMIIAKTIKGKGVSFLEDKNGWHGKALDKDELDQALKELGDVDKTLRGQIAEPEDLGPERRSAKKVEDPFYDRSKSVATRKAYGNALRRIFPQFPEMVVLDAEVSNSTYSEIFQKAYPERFFEMFIAEQNMVGTALGLSARNKIPFISTFAAFFTRAFDQIRMSQYSDANIKFCGSHAGVSIGEDGPSQMGLEDIAMFRTVFNSVVLYPSDAVSTEKMVQKAAEHRGMVYLRTTRMNTPIIYDEEEDFPIGACKVLRGSENDRATVISAGITLHESLKAFEDLRKGGIPIRVVDLYCIKPINQAILAQAIGSTTVVLTVEDHYPEGGIGEAVRSAMAGHCLTIHSLSVKQMPRSGRPEELLDYENVSCRAIVRRIRELI